ncbi:MAG: acyl-CoA dehydrogenase family protein, partial [Gammaproteobacteria bacterium]|nr:acyl-CoA dehydrogenase family protein [Gammaproteobacteria bacterium]
MNNDECNGVIHLESPELSYLRNSVDRAFRHLAERVSPRDGRIGSEQLDAVQLQCFDLAWCIAELEACRSVLMYSDRAQDLFAAKLTSAFVAEALQTVHARLMARADDFGLSLMELLDSVPTRNAAIAHALSAEFLEDVGREWITRDGCLPPNCLDNERELMRETFARFARDVVEPRAQEVHRADLDVPEEIISGAAALGLFGVTIPQRFGGLQADNSPDTLTMVVVTEALS